MADDTLSSEFYWDTVVFKVEDKLFCVPRCEFVKSSEVFADMFLLPSGSVAHNEGEDRDHPIVLEGYKKDEFTCLLRVMYPTAGSQIFGTKLDLCLEKEEWVSVLKLSVIWNMKKIRDYAIHRLSTDVALSPVEKILLARAHKVPTWLDEGVSSLISSDHRPTLADLATLGWETAARILWIRENSSPSVNASNTLSFRKDAIKCGYCSSSSSLINDAYNCYRCGNVVLADEELTYPGPVAASPGTASRLVYLRGIQSSKCGGNPFYSNNVYCRSCSQYSSPSSNVRIMPNQMSNEMIKEMFGEEIKDYELAMAV